MKANEADNLPILGTIFLMLLLINHQVHTPMRGILGQVQPFIRGINGESMPQVNVQKNETTVSVYGRTVTFDCDSLLAQVSF